MLCVPPPFPAETVSAVAGSIVSGYADGVGLSASFASPYGATPTAAGNFLLVAEYSGRIRAVRLSDCTPTPAACFC